ncbi:hypothetical protein S245_058472, partial [Arachis hypogaea]
KICGTNNVDEKYQDLVYASEAASKVENSWKNIIGHNSLSALLFWSPNNSSELMSSCFML